MSRRAPNRRSTKPYGLRIGLVVSSVLVACGQGPGSTPDGGTAIDTGASDPPFRIPWLDEGQPPIAPPMLTPCPEGWHEVAGDPGADESAVITCAPYGNGAVGAEPEDCADGWAHFISDEGCTPVGAPCPTGNYPEGLPADAEVLFVRSSAPAGGDGTESSPLTTIADAMNLASLGTVIALGKGDYDEPVHLGPGVTLWGACAAETRLTASSPDPRAQGVITAHFADTHLRNLRIGPANLPGLVAFGASTSVSVDGIVIHEVGDRGLQVLTGAEVRGRQLVVTRTQANGAGGGGHGIAVETGGTVDLTQVVLSENRAAGALARGEESSLTLSDLLVTETRAQEGVRTGGWGLGAQLGATAVLRRALVSHNHETGVDARDQGTSVVLSDVVIRDTQGRENDDTGGSGLSVAAGATARLTRVLFSHNRNIGVLASEENTSLTLSDVVIRDTQGQESDRTQGYGLAVRAGATAQLSHTWLSGNHLIGLVATDEGTSLTASDIVIRDTEGQESDGIAGAGLGVLSGATAEMARALLSHNRTMGVFAIDEGSSLTMSDVVVRDTQSQDSDGAWGLGSSTVSGAVTQVTRGVFSRNRGIGLLAHGPGAGAELADIVVEHTDEQFCASTTCADAPFGVGLASTASASLRATRLAVVDSLLCGVLLADSGQVDLSVGEISGSKIGVCLQVDGYAIARLMDQMRYVDNDTNMDTTRLPIPEPPSAATELK